jgi:carbonic anhydrase
MIFLNGEFMDSGLERLLKGNDNFRKGIRTNYDVVKRRSDVYSSQHPYAVIVSCSDSRVVPELIFDANIGELFVVRTAGNVVDAVGLGSIEYGLEHLHAPLLVIMAHENCGAVSACCAGSEALCNISEIIKRIAPAAEKAKKNVAATVDENAKLVIDTILKESKIVSHLKQEGKLEIVIMRYSLKDGSAIVIDKR